MSPRKDAYIAFGEVAEEYGRMYGRPDFSKCYPAEQKRLEIAVALLDAIKPRMVLDVGCGSGEPMVDMLKRGHKVYGFDLAPEMVEAAHKNLVAAGLPADLVSINDMEDIKGIERGAYDCIVGLGVYPYARNFQQAIRQSVDLLPPGGHMIFSLRNELLSLFSLNAYSGTWYRDSVLEFDKMSEPFGDAVLDFMGRAFEGGKIDRRVFDTVDDMNIHSLWHNPLTTEAEIIRPNGLELRGIYYYHFHAAPPKFEHVFTEEFRRLSWAMEDPTDWRGVFMTSTYVVHATKRA